MAMKINPYLNFDGQAEEAMKFYHSVLGGEMTEVNRFGEIPPQEGMPEIPEEEKNRVMHVGLQVTPEIMIMATDIAPSMGQKLVVGNNNHISVHPESREEADRIFAGLSEGGKVEMPMQDMFWGDYYGAFDDKYGVKWMINFHKEENK